MLANRGPIAAAALLTLLATAASLASGCGGESGAAPARVLRGAATGGAKSIPVARAAVVAAPVRRTSDAPVVAVPRAGAGAFEAVATVGGEPAAWIAQRSGVTLLRFDQAHVRLALHAGAAEPGSGGWRYGPSIGRDEAHRVLAGFNGGFKLSYGSVGFVEAGRVAVALSPGLGSIVTYANGTTQIGAWREGVPARGVPILSVRQNLRLLVDHGASASTVDSCGGECWGQTLGGGTSVARSALGIDAAGRLVWAAGESLTPGELARALTGVGVQRAVELDINPYWVAGYLYVHRPSGPSPVPVVPGQHGIAGELLEPDSRDFFTVLAR